MSLNLSHWKKKNILHFNRLWMLEKKLKQTIILVPQKESALAFLFYYGM